MSNAARILSLRSRMAQLQTSPAEVGLPVRHELQAPLGLADLPPGKIVSLSSTSRTLALHLLAAASEMGAWIALIGWPDFGAECAVTAGIDLNRTVHITVPPAEIATTAASLSEVFPLLAITDPPPFGAHNLQRLMAKLRENKSSLVILTEQQHSTELIHTAPLAWGGLGAGQGMLTTELIEISRPGQDTKQRNTVRINNGRLNQTNQKAFQNSQTAPYSAKTGGLIALNT